MMIEKMGRSTFNSRYTYHITEVKTDEEYEHCGNCCHFGMNSEEIWIWSGHPVCSLMVQSGICFELAGVNGRRGLCSLWQVNKRAKEEGK